MTNHVDATPDATAASEPARSTSDGAPLLVVDNLVTKYPVRRGMIAALRRAPRRHVNAVDGVSFTLRAGEMVALVGESGCGKTTTAQTILRLVDPVSGTIRLRGQDITHLSDKDMRPLRGKIQMIYQDPYESLDPRFRVRHTIEEPMIIHRIGTSGSDREQRVFDALRRAELTPPELYIDRFPHELSGGQRQRAAIAASLVLDPDLLVADEPVSMLDVSVRAGVLTLLDGLRANGNMGVLMITHDLSTAAHFADRIAVMYLGRIVEEGPAREVVSNPRHPYTKALLSVVPKRDPRNRSQPQILQGETPNPIDIPPGCRFHPRCPVAEPRCSTIDPQLHPATDATPEHEAACVLV
jgi:oligopeptide/dipeptide ABC transporter ATP-binding protein